MPKIKIIGHKKNSKCSCHNQMRSEIVRTDQGDMGLWCLQRLVLPDPVRFARQRDHKPTGHWLLTLALNARGGNEVLSADEYVFDIPGPNDDIENMSEEDAIREIESGEGGFPLGI